MRSNVILITIDSLRADKLGCLGYNRRITPNLDKIAKEGCLFSQAISVSHSTRTSFPGIFASMYPFVFLKLTDKGYMQIPEGVKTITEVLKEGGYYTLAFNSNPLLTFYRNYHKGFDHCEGLLEKEKLRIFKSGLQYVKKLLFKKPILPYPTPEQVNTRVISLLKKNKKYPFFLWIHHMNVHSPYYPPKRFLKGISNNISNSEMIELEQKRTKPDEVTKRDLKKLIDLYDAEIKYVDYYIGKFIEELKNIGIDFNNTFFIITSDHGEEFKEHGGLGHPAKLYDELIRVPLIIVGPELNKCIIKEQCSLLSLPPTILSLTLKDSFPDFQGKDLSPLMVHGVGGEKYVISEGCEKNEKSNTPRAINKKISCRTLSWKYIYNYNGKEELYSLTEDPRERVNVVDEEREVVKEFRKKILEHLKMEEVVVRRMKEVKRIREVAKMKRF